MIEEEENRDLDPIQDLPEELARLDEELRDFEVSERPSFAPELQAELEREWLRRLSEPAAPARRGRRIVAAAAAAVLFATLSVPPARASLVELSRQALVSFGVLDGEQPRPFAQPAFLTAPAPDRPAPPLDVRLGPAETGQPADEEGTAMWETPSFTGIRATFPEIADRAAEQETIRRYYPEDLQRRGIGGLVRFRLWVDSVGRVDNVNVYELSDQPRLNSAALMAVRDLQFIPATRAGRPVGTWVEFDMVFEPSPDASAAEISSAARPGDVGTLPSFPDVWPAESVITPPTSAEARELLSLSLEGQGGALERLGHLDNLLRGVPPAGVSPLGWRADAMDALERALARDPDNPAPYLALGRILTRQGLDAEALRLFERGIARAARRVRPGSPPLVADLQYERGMLLKETWSAWASLGTLDTEQTETPRCARVGAVSDLASLESVIALNFLCPAELDRIVASSFRPVTADADYHAEMLEAFRAAVRAQPDHVGANIQLLLSLAADERWFELLNGARRFAWLSRGHPHALLLSGLALQRMGRSEEAAEEFETAFRALPDEQIRALRGIRILLDPQDASDLDALAGERLDAAVREFWARLDPILSTKVNEREVEHLARGAHALLRFGGPDTDAGELWVRYGAPQAVRTLGSGTDLRTELWDYGRAPYVAFRRPATSSSLELTPEARAYLDDLLQVFPHRYGSEARRVFTLPATMARFRTPDGGSEVEIRTRAPEEIRRSYGQTLTLGLYTLGPNGEVLRDTVQELSGQDIRIRAPTPPGAAQVVLEIYNAEEGEVAAARTFVPRGAGTDDDRISDLLWVEADDPHERRVDRRDPWVRLLPARPVEGERLGVLFELYGLPVGSEPYHIRVEAVPEGGGPAVKIPFRPSGQTLFGPVWARRPDARAGTTTEYLVLDLGAVEPGTHELRVTVELAGGEDPIVATREFERGEPSREEQPR